MMEQTMQASAKTLQIETITLRNKIRGSYDQ
jgi:hypothetical protein